MRIFQVDAFTGVPYGGNPAAVCLLPATGAPRDGHWMQQVAAEMNVSETAFVEPRSGTEYGLRWFTPTTEVDLCGHATLAAAHVLGETGLQPAPRLSFHTRSGVLTTERDGEGIRMDFPAEPPEPAEPPAPLAAALGCTPLWSGRNRFDHLVRVADAATVRELRPDFAVLRTVPARGVIVTAPGDGGGVDFVSRFFAPASGVDEDPVTGSAHCCLAPYWSAETGRHTFTAQQVSARGGRLGVRVEGDRVLLTGQAVTVLRGELL